MSAPCGMPQGNIDVMSVSQSVRAPPESCYASRTSMNSHTSEIRLKCQGLARTILGVNDSVNAGYVELPHFVFLLSTAAAGNALHAGELFSSRGVTVVLMPGYCWWHNHGKLIEWQLGHRWL